MFFKNKCHFSSVNVKINSQLFNSNLNRGFQRTQKAPTHFLSFRFVFKVKFLRVILNKFLKIKSETVTPKSYDN